MKNSTDIPQQFNLTVCPSPFSARKEQKKPVAGLRLSEVVAAEVRPGLRQYANVWLDGEFIPFEVWPRLKIKAGTHVAIRVVPQGGGGKKNILSTVLSIAFMAIAPGIGASLAAATGGWVGGTFFGVTAMSNFFTGLVGVVGKLALSALAPPPKQPGRIAQEKTTQFITGAQNRINPYGVVPKPMGRIRMVPPLGARPYTETAGADQYLRMLFVWGYGPMEISDIRIGDTSIDEFEDVDIETVEGYDDDADLTLFPRDVYQEDLSVTLVNADGYQTRTTQADTDEISIDVTFPRGLVDIGGLGKKREATVQIEVGYSVTGAGVWTTQYINSTAAQSAAFVKNLRIKVSRNQYDVRLKRTTADTAVDNIADTAVWTTLRSITNEPPVNMPGLAMTAVRIKATDQLNGVIDRFNGIVHSVLPDWDGVDWETEAATSNPASIYRAILQGSANARALADSRINLTDLQEWHENCAADDREFNGIIEGGSVRDALAAVAACGRASPAIIDGQWTVVEDKERTDIVQHFTPRNTWGFSGEKAYPDQPHAFRVQFLNRDNDWLPDERIVYDDGYTAANATKFESLDLTSGVTSADQAWKDGRYHIATARLRPETYTFNADIEHIVCTRGDLIRFTHDVTLHGLGHARVKSLTDDGTNVLTVTLDDTVTMESGTDYSVRFRLADGSTLLKNVITVAGEATTLTFATPFAIADAPAAGDLALFGEYGTESVELVVKSIEPQGDLSARLTCVDHAPAIFSSDSGTIPAFDSQITVPVDLQRPPAPVLQSIQSDDKVLIRTASGYATAVVITLAPPDFPAALSISATARRAEETDYFPVQFVTSLNQITIIGLESGDYYDLSVIYSNPSGMQSPELLIAGHFVTGDTGVPSDVENFKINILSGTAYLSWDAPADLDIAGYRIKFNTSSSGANWSNSVDLVTRISAPATAATVPASTGTYLIKAVDRGGRESAAETTIISTFNGLDGFNAIETVTENPSFAGATSNVTVNSNTIYLTDTTLEGTYTFDNEIDLGAVYTSLLSASIEATGADGNSSVDDWANIDLVENWDGTVDPTTWNVRLQVRTTDDNPGGSPTWSEWGDFVIGQYSARAFQFRVILSSTVEGVTPVVSALSCSADMPDRVQGENDMSSASTDNPTTVVPFPDSFQSTPAIAITAQSMATGDYYTITNASRTGFEIIFKNAAGTRVTRTFDYVAKGYGQTPRGYEQETLDLLAEMTTQPDDDRIALIDRTIAALKTTGVWAKFDAFYMLAVGDAQAAGLNWCNPSGTALTATNSPTFTADQGYTGVSTAYLNTGLATNGLSNFVRDSAHIGFWSRTTSTFGGNDMGVYGVATTRLRNYNGGSNIAARLHDATTNIIATASGVGHYVVNRSGASARQFYYQGASVGTDAVASTVNPSASNMDILRADTSDSRNQLAAAHFGSSLTAQNVTDLQGILQVWMTEVGA